MRLVAVDGCTLTSSNGGVITIHSTTLSDKLIVGGKRAYRREISGMVTGVTIGDLVGESASFNIAGTSVKLFIAGSPAVLEGDTILVPSINALHASTGAAGKVFTTITIKTAGQTILKSI